VEVKGGLQIEGSFLVRKFLGGMENITKNLLGKGKGGNGV